MTANVFDCSDVVDEEGIATKESMIGWMSKVRTKAETMKRGRQPLH